MSSGGDASRDEQAPRGRRGSVLKSEVFLKVFHRDADDGHDEMDVVVRPGVKRLTMVFKSEVFSRPAGLSLYKSDTTHHRQLNLFHPRPFGFS